MPVGPHVQLDTREMNRMLGELSDTMTGIAFSKIVKAESTSILSRAAEKTKSASITKIRKRYRIKSRQRKHLPDQFQERKTTKKGTKGKYKLKVPKRGVKGSKLQQNRELIGAVKIDGKLYLTRNYYPKPIFEKIKTKLKELEEKAIARRHSGKATWYLIAKKARLPLSNFKDTGKYIQVVGKQNSEFRKNTVENGSQHPKRTTFHVKIFNGANCCLNRFANGEYQFKQAMKNRISFYKTNMRLGVFKKAKDEIKAYPNVYAEDNT